jgi:serine/threonine-protein kinase
VLSYSDSNVIGVPSTRAGTMLGVGPPSGTMPMAHAKRQASMTETSALGGGAPAADEGTGSRITGSRYTGTMTLPVNRRLPIIASALGLLVLLIAMGVVLLGRGPDTPTGLAPSASASGAASAAPTSSAVVTASSAPSNIPEPQPSGSAAAVDSAQPGVDIKPPGTSAHTATTAHTFRPPVTAPPPRTATPAPVPGRKNCDPPYTIDSNGRKKYKLECM